MNPEAFLAHAAVPSVHLPDLHPLLDSIYEPYDLGVMGELDVSILTELFGGPQMSAALAPAWNGGIYYAAQRRSTTAAEKTLPASIGLLYYSRWKNADSARSFLNVYAAQLPRKYSNVERRQDLEKAGEQVYSTSEGEVLLSIAGDSVFTAESFDLTVSRRLRERDQRSSARRSTPFREVEPWAFLRTYPDPVPLWPATISGVLAIYSGSSQNTRPKHANST